MKKLLSVFLIAASLTAFGCGGAEQKHGDEEKKAATEEKHEEKHAADHKEDAKADTAKAAHGEEHKAEEAAHH